MKLTLVGNFLTPSNKHIRNTEINSDAPISTILNWSDEQLLLIKDVHKEECIAISFKILNS